MESLFGTLKTELVHQCDYPDRPSARRDLLAYIKDYYNRRQIYSATNILLQSRQTGNPHNPVSNLPGERHCSRSLLRALQQDARRRAIHH
jgi:transposase InsO family protein